MGDHFLAYFLECNQTIENIFIFKKYFSLEKIWYFKSILHRAKHSLSKLDFVIKFKQLDESFLEKQLFLYFRIDFLTFWILPRNLHPLLTTLVMDSLWGARNEWVFQLNETNVRDLMVTIQKISREFKGGGSKVHILQLGLGRKWCKAPYRPCQNQL